MSGLTAAVCVLGQARSGAALVPAWPAFLGSLLRAFSVIVVCPSGDETACAAWNGTVVAAPSVSLQDISQLASNMPEKLPGHYVRTYLHQLSDFHACGTAIAADNLTYDAFVRLRPDAFPRGELSRLSSPR